MNTVQHNSAERVPVEENTKDVVLSNDITVQLSTVTETISRRTESSCITVNEAS